jgi:hypothetical protein
MASAASAKVKGGEKDEASTKIYGIIGHAANAIAINPGGSGC